MKNKFKLVLAIPNLEALGVQHDVLTLFRYWQDPQWDLTLLVHTRTGDFADKFSRSIKIVCVDDYLKLNIPKLRVLERFFIGYPKALAAIDPNVVISFVPICNYGCFFGKCLLKRKFALVVSEHAHVTGAMADPQNMGGIFMSLYRRTFRYVYNSRFVNLVKCIAHESLEDLVTNHQVLRHKVAMVHNPIPIDELRLLAKERVEHKWLDNDRHGPIIVNSGRISYQKQQDILIRAFSKVKVRYPEAKLIVLGKGDSSKLRALSDHLEVSDSVEFLGHQKNPWAIISKCNLFVLSSIWEGLPCVLTETQAIGVPIVSTQCPSGPKEILINGDAGVLCETGNVDSLTEAIFYALDNPRIMESKVNVATKNVSRFDPRMISSMYAELAKKAHDLQVNCHV